MIALFSKLDVMRSTIPIDLIKMVIDGENMLNRLLMMMVLFALLFPNFPSLAYCPGS